MNIQLYEQLWTEFEDQEYRHAYSESLVDSTIATQIKLLREQNVLTQAQLAELSGMKQSRISAMEDVNYSSWSITTLKRLAKTYDCGLEVRFVPFEHVVRWGASMSPDALRVPRFDEDAKAHKSRKKAVVKVSSQELIRVFKVIPGVGQHTQRALSFMRPNLLIIGGAKTSSQIAATTGEKTVIRRSDDTTNMNSVTTQAAMV